MKLKSLFTPAVLGGALLASLSGCAHQEIAAEKSPAKSESLEWHENEASKVTFVYDIDTQTGVCYAMGFVRHYNNVNMVMVPATPEVLQNIPAKKLEILKEKGIEPLNWLDSAPARQAAPAPAP